MSVLSDAALAVLLGGALGGGLVAILAAMPRWRAASLTTRIAPYVRDVVADDLLPRDVLPRIGVLPSGRKTLWRRLQSGFERMLGGGGVLGQRLTQAGIHTGVTAFRGRQLGWALVGTGVGAVLVIALALSGRLSPPAALLPLVAGVMAVVACDMVLSARVKARRARLTDELPTTLEFLALCLSAGEGFLDSLRRVSSVGAGELTAEFRQVVLAVSTGSPLVDALGSMASRLQLPALSRAIDQVVAALEHGAPLAGVLHAQAGDAREEAKRVLIEQAGRKEILMLLPSKIAKRYFDWLANDYPSPRALLWRDKNSSSVIASNSSLSSASWGSLRLYSSTFTSQFLASASRCAASSRNPYSRASRA